VKGQKNAKLAPPWDDLVMNECINTKTVAEKNSIERIKLRTRGTRQNVKKELE